MRPRDDEAPLGRRRCQLIGQLRRIGCAHLYCSPLLPCPLLCAFQASLDFLSTPCTVASASVLRRKATAAAQRPVAAVSGLLSSWDSPGVWLQWTMTAPTCPLGPEGSVGTRSHRAGRSLLSAPRLSVRLLPHRPSEKCIGSVSTEPLPGGQRKKSKNYAENHLGFFQNQTQ